LSPKLKITMSQEQKLHLTLNKLFEILEQIDIELYQGQECLGERLAQYQTQETLTDIQRTMHYYQAKKLKVIDEINNIRRLLGLPR
jgi:hypothetical protein